MRVLAAKFRHRARASTVLNQLQQTLRVRPPDVAIAPLGLPGTQAADETLLAGRFADDRVSDVIRMVHEEGGEIVANVEEAWNLTGQPEDGRHH